MSEQLFLNRYKVARPLGQGGMGRVFLARDLESGQPAVVKVMHEHIALRPKFRERFASETRLMSRLQHPHTVAFLDSSTDDDPQGPFIVMEYVPGVTLDKLLAKNHRFSPFRLQRLVGQICDVLQSAHDVGIAHKDLKPANLMVSNPETPTEHLKIMDFGLAQLTGGPEDPSSDEGEYAVGTPGYMSPEQVRGERVDHRGDLYSVGVILYQLLTGILPFQGDSVMEILLAQAESNPPTFESLGLGDSVPAAVEEVVRACLALDPAARPQSASELGEWYQAAVEHGYGGADPEGAETGDPAETSAQAESGEGEPGVTVRSLEAWMPEQIAGFKVQGFAEAVGGRVIESIPGLVRVRVPVRRPPSLSSRLGSLLTLGLVGGRAAHIDMELRMEIDGTRQDNHLNIAVLFCSNFAETGEVWEARGDHLFHLLRAHLLSR